MLRRLVVRGNYFLKSSRTCLLLKKNFNIPSSSFYHINKCIFSKDINLNQQPLDHNNNEGSLDNLLIDIFDLRNATFISEMDSLNETLKNAESFLQNLESLLIQSNKKKVENDEKVTKIAGHVLPLECWNIVNLLLKRTFLNIHGFNDFENAKLDIDKLKYISDKCELLLCVNNGNLENEEGLLIEKLKNMVLILEKEIELYQLTNHLKELEDSLNNDENKEQIRNQMVELLEHRFQIYFDFGNGKEAHSDICKAIQMLEEDLKKKTEEQEDGIDTTIKNNLAKCYLLRAKLFFTILSDFNSEVILDKIREGNQFVLEEIKYKLIQLCEVLDVDHRELFNPKEGDELSAMVFLRSAKYQAKAGYKIRDDITRAKELDPEMVEQDVTFKHISEFSQKTHANRRKLGFVILFFIVATVSLSYFVKALEKNVGEKPTTKTTEAKK
ncbi:hypothetical protein ABK040_001088 [Willaertia magna]